MRGSTGGRATVYRDSKTNSCQGREEEEREQERERERERRGCQPSGQTRISGSRTTSHGGPFDLRLTHLPPRTPSISANGHQRPPTPPRLSTFPPPSPCHPAASLSVKFGFLPRASISSGSQLHSPASTLLTSTYSRKARASRGQAGERGGFIQFYYYYAYRHA